MKGNASSGMPSISCFNSSRVATTQSNNKCRTIVLKSLAGPKVHEERPTHAAIPTMFCTIQRMIPKAQSLKFCAKQVESLEMSEKTIQPSIAKSHNEVGAASGVREHVLLLWLPYCAIGEEAATFLHVARRFTAEYNRP